MSLSNLIGKKPTRASRTARSGPTITRGASSGDIWTPQVFIDAVEQKFGPLIWDLAGSEINKRAPFVLTEELDSLKYVWMDLRADGTYAPQDGGTGPLLWLNPPFSNITLWAAKCAAEWKLGAEILLLVPMGSQNWYWDYIEPFAQVYAVGRMVFDNCFDRVTGEAVTTPYARDLILCHYRPGVSLNKMVRWKWEVDNVTKKTVAE